MIICSTSEQYSILDQLCVLGSKLQTLQIRDDVI